MDTYENPGHDATPAACELCDVAFGLNDVIVKTSWGLMHLACAASHDDLERAAEMQP